MGTGGKVDGRQMMINMMYLVLTAMLALNVSRSVLDAFEIISESLRDSAQTLKERNSDYNSNLADYINEQAEENGNTDNLIYLKALKEIADSSQSMITYLESLNDSIFDIAGRDPETGSMMNKGETTKNYQFWMGEGGDQKNDGRGAGYALDMHQRLDTFVDWANQLYYQYSAKEDDKREKPNNGEGYDYFIHDPEKKGAQQNQTWEFKTFNEVPAIANVAIIEKFKNDVARMETQLLNFIESKLQNVKFKIDELKAVVVPESKVVAAGLPFKAELYVAMISKSMKPNFSGRGVTTADDGNSAEMEITASADYIKKGESTGEQPYTATIRVPKASGGEEVLEVKESFTVVRPVVKVTAKGVDILYAACANDLELDVPALGNAYDPVFEAKGAKVIPSPKSKKVIRLVPSLRANRCVVQVSTRTGGEIFKIDDVSWNVIKPPKPTIRWYSNRNEVQSGSSVSPKAPFEIQVVADKQFAKDLRQDARYQFKNVVVKAKIGLGGVKTLKTYTQSTIGPKASLKIRLTQALGNSYQRGMDVYLIIGDIFRVNFENKAVPLTDFSQGERTLAVIMK